MSKPINTPSQKDQDWQASRNFLFYKRLHKRHGNRQFDLSRKFINKSVGQGNAQEFIDTNLIRVSGYITPAEAERLGVDPKPFTFTLNPMRRPEFIRQRKKQDQFLRKQCKVNNVPPTKKNKQRMNDELEMQEAFRDAGVSLERFYHQAETNTFDYTYGDKSLRPMNNFQNVKSEWRDKAFLHAGWDCKLDINNAIMTLLFQLFKKTGDDNDEVYEPKVLKDFALDNNLKKQTRDRLSKTYGLDINEQVKPILAAIITGATWNKGRSEWHNEDGAIWTLCNKNHVVFNALKNDTFIKDLCDDLRKGWSIVNKFGNDYWRPRKSWSGRLIRMSPADKNSIYDKLEQEAMNATRSYLTKQGIDHASVHDGLYLRTNGQSLDIQLLEHYVLKRTGWCVTFSFDHLNHDEDKSRKNHSLEGFCSPYEINPQTTSPTHLYYDNKMFFYLTHLWPQHQHFGKKEPRPDGLLQFINS